MLPAKLPKLLLCVLLLWQGAAEAVRAQQSPVPLGGWQLHVPYRQAKALTLAGDLVYVAATNGLFYYDSEFSTTETVSKVDGLSEQQISDIAYDAASDIVVIVYENTKVDLLQGNSIYTITDVFRKSIAGEKKVNSVYVHNKLAYLSTSFGVVVLDLQKREVKATYSNLGPNGEEVQAKALAVLQDQVYLATNYGVLAATLSGANLQDYRSWRNISSGLPINSPLTGIVSFNETVYALAGGTIYRYSSGTWSSAATGSFTGINTTGAYLSATSGSGILLIDESGTSRTVAGAQLASPREAAATAAGTVWVADAVNGLVQLNATNGQTAVYTPSGPYSDNSFNAYAYNGKVYILSGGYSESYVPSGITDGFSVYAAGEWQNYTNALPADVVDAVYNPITEKLYLASYGGGLIAWSRSGETTTYNSTNSPLQPLSGTQQVPLTDVAVDWEGNVWMVNRNLLASQAGIYKLSPEGEWQAYRVPGISDATNLEHLLLDDYGQLWLTISLKNNTSAGLVVYDAANSRQRRLTVGEGNGNLPSGAVYAMAKDLSGDIWVGTANGVGVYYSPAFVFESAAYDARIPIIDGRPLLDGQLVRSIAVDGANRKWMGTDNGLWLFNPDGDELLAHYTSENSPLPDNQVIAVAVEHASGEVFAVTAAGTASLRMGATVTEGEPDCATVYPNPVRRNYNGQVGIADLPNNADVRITDVSGALVYKGRATGGTFAWDTRDYNGKRVQAGVYLVLAASPDGSQTCISKIAVLD